MYDDHPLNWVFFYALISKTLHIYSVSLIFFLRQIAVADLTIINKTDLVAEEELNQVRDAVRSASLIVHPFSNLQIEKYPPIPLSF